MKRIWVIEWRETPKQQWKLMSDPPFKGRCNAKMRADGYAERCSGEYRVVAYVREDASVGREVEERG